MRIKLDIRFSLLKILFVALIAMPGFAGDELLVWGQMNGTGFTFVGREDLIRNQCEAFIRIVRIESLSKVVIRREEISLPTRLKGVLICSFITTKAEKLGLLQPFIFSRGLVANIPYSFAGSTSSVVRYCVEFLVANGISHQMNIEVEGVPVTARRGLHGQEICGEIASRGIKYDAPFTLYYAAGEILTRSYMFLGTREDFMLSCLSNIRVGSTIRINDFIIDDQRIALPKPAQDAAICDAIFANARPIKNSVAVFSAGGMVRNHPFWFTGTAQSFLNQCKTWFPAERIDTVNEFSVGKIVIRLPFRAQGSGVCGLILRNAEIVEPLTDLTLAWGQIAGKGFAFSGSAETFRARCETFLNHYRIGYVKEFLLGDGSDAKRIPFTRPLNQSALCGTIRSKAIPLKPPFFLWHVEGIVRGRPYVFKGGIEEVVTQCSDFYRIQGIESVEGFTAFEKNIVLSPPLAGAQSCGRMLSVAKITDNEPKVFVGGQVNGNGFSLATSRGIALLVCRGLLQSANVVTANKIRVFNEEFQFPNALPSTEAICDEVLKKSVQFPNEFPEVDAKIEVAGNVIEAKGKVDAANWNCYTRVQELGIANVGQMVVNGKELKSPFGFWNGAELCAAAFKEVIHEIND